MAGDQTGPAGLSADCVFRCTYCNQLIPRTLAAAELGMAPGEYPIPDHLYPYASCYCGRGRFVIAELRDGASKWTLHAHPAERLANVAESGGRAPALPGGAAAAPRGQQEVGEPMLREKVEGAAYRKLPIAEIRPNPAQPRRFFDQEALRALADSIQQVGLLEDVLVRPVPGGYELVLGERRWRATQLAGLPSISAKVVELSDEEVRRISIVENVQREDLTEVEEAFAYKGFLDQGLRQADVGSALGRMGDRVAERLKVLSSHHYVEYQEERIRQLTAELQALRAQVVGAGTSYDVRIVARDALPETLAAGYDLVLTLDPDQFVVRKRI